MLADERASTGHLRGREVRGGAPGEEEQCARAHTSWPFWLLGLPPRSSRAKSSHEGWALGLREEMRGSALVRRVSSGWCGARGAVWSGCVRAVVQEDGRRSEGSEEEMQWRMEAVLAVRRGVVGALASGDARVRRACAAVRGGARAEAGWWRVPRRGLRASWECGCGLFLPEIISLHATSSDLFRKVTLQKNPAVAPIERSQPLPEGGRTMAFPLRIISNKQTDPAMIKNSSSI